MVCLIKPGLKQEEKVGVKGVVRDKVAHHLEVIEMIPSVCDIYSFWKS